MYTDLQAVPVLKALGGLKPSLQTQKPTSITATGCLENKLAMRGVAENSGCRRCCFTLKE